jgi:phosphate starvation-inducible protein PhoH and related proteins
LINPQLKPSTHVQDVVLEPVDNQRLANLCGQFDEHLRQLEERLAVEINHRSNVFRVVGPPLATETAERILLELYRVTADEVLSPSRIHFYLQQAGLDDLLATVAPLETVIRTQRAAIKARGRNQHHYIECIHQHDINFGIGPAGTGKTYLAVACAVQALESQRVRRLVLVRPAVEAGERLGFLPGDIAQKVDPYLRPLYDALYEMLGFEKVGKLIERSVIEIAPLAFMRGRTLNESFIILDEAQNTTPEQMKMFLTRLGYGSTAVVTGDITQVDLPVPSKSGLRQVIDILPETPGVSFTFFTAKDVVRHAVVARILEAYDAYDVDRARAEHKA